MSALPVSVDALPPGWSLVRLGMIGRFSASGIDKKSVDGEVPVRMVNYTDVYGSKARVIDGSSDLMAVTCSREKLTEHSLRRGDLLFTPSSETKDEIGFSAVVTRDMPEIVYSYHLVRFRPVSDVRLDLNFQKYWCNHRGFLSQLQAATKGTTRQILTRDDFRSARVVLPPLEEQRAIASFLDRETARIDTLIVKKQRLLDLLEEKRLALITRAVTRGLDPDVSMKDSGVEWIGDIPQHWELRKTPWLFRIGSGTTPKSDEPSYFGGDIPWVTTSELRESRITSTARTITDLALQDYSVLRLHPPESVVVAMYGATIGRVGTLGVSAAVNQACCVFYNPDVTISRFAFYWFQAYRSEVVGLASGGGQPNISQDVLRSLRLAVPPSDERAAILKKIENELSLLQLTESRVNEATRLLQEYRTAVISAAVTGKIDVRQKVPA